MLRDMAGDAASKAANVVRPSEDQLSQIDQAAPENTWHEKPDFSKEGLKSQAKAQQERFKGSVCYNLSSSSIKIPFYLPIRYRVAKMEPMLLVPMATLLILMAPILTVQQDQRKMEMEIKSRKRPKNSLRKRCQKSVVTKPYGA